MELTIDHFIYILIYILYTHTGRLNVRCYKKYVDQINNLAKSTNFKENSFNDQFIPTI